jgi:hypothetical protein
LCIFSDWFKNYRRKKEAKMYRGPLICPIGIVIACIHD